MFPIIAVVVADSFIVCSWQPFLGAFEDALGPLHALVMMFRYIDGPLAHAVDLLSALSYYELPCHHGQCTIQTK